MAGISPMGFGGGMPQPQPQPPIMFSRVGIVNLSGTGYAYPPGSGMTQFLDSLNTQMFNATKIANPTPQATPQTAGGSSQLMTMLGMLLGKLTQAGILKRKSQAVQ